MTKKSYNPIEETCQYPVTSFRLGFSPAPVFGNFHRSDLKWLPFNTLTVTNTIKIFEINILPDLYLQIPPGFTSVAVVKTFLCI